MGAEGLQRTTDVLVGALRLGHRVKLVDGEHDGGHAQQLQQQRMAARLRQQRQVGILPVELGGIDQHHGGIGLRCGGDHVARVLLVPRCVADDELARFGREVAPGDVDGDALLALGLQAVGELRQIGLAAARDAGQVVLQHRPAVHQQAPDQCALAIIDGAAGDEAQGGLGVFWAAGDCGVCASSYGYCTGHGSAFFERKERESDAKVAK